MPIAVPAPSCKVSPWGEKVFPPTWPLSAWQRSTRDDPLINHGRDDPLPETADIVIIGSGISGASVAYNLLSAPNRPKNIVVLEARECTSGASGRNAGHCRPDAFRGFIPFAAMHGPEESRLIMQSEVTTLKNVKEFLKKHPSIDCEFTPRPTLDLCLTQEFKDFEQASLEVATKNGVDTSFVRVLDKDEAQKVSGSSEAVGAYEWPASTVNPAKFCYGIHRTNFSLGGYSLFTHTPVTGVTAVQDAQDEYRWSVNCTRGSVRAAKVVYATNAYTKLILPEMDGLITPMLAQAVQVTPPPNSEFPRIQPSMSLRYSLNHFYSVASRPDNSVVLGTTMIWPGQTEAEFDALFDTMDDSKPYDQIRDDTFNQFANVVSGGGWDSSPPVEEGKNGLDYTWAGVIAMTPDKVPWVGPLPGREGQYIMSGFNGHGMARIFHCAPCLASVILGGQWDPTVPSVFKATQERMDRLGEKVKKEGFRMKPG
ncbi:hypothetical protein IAR55_000049 [Kwoniella newhampshirensis]|uniref:FAD dependent oxidoreductase domain-containing protein n=1 Tax=Kwoniella newhampshirensis TaxID=1651941 RepID=A0AAW0Z5J1_9TREE